jgi:hypothetical protein
MKTTIRFLPILICSCVLGCSTTVPRPMRYVAVAQPTTIPPPLQVKGERVEVSKTRVLPNIRLPRDAAELLGELQTKAGEPVLRNADLNLTTSICFFVCVNTDTATAEKTP